jgi:hypothetical protein
MTTSPPEDVADDSYRLLSIARTNAPSGGEGRDWVEYRIVQGVNIITGYRRGSISSVTEDVKKVVEGLNERRHVRRGRVDLTTRPAAQPAAEPADTEETS